MRAAELLRDLGTLLLPTACGGCGDAVPPELDGPVCLRCRTRLKPVPGPVCGRCGLPMGTTDPVAGQVSEKARRAEPGCDACADWPEVLEAARSAAVLADPATRLIHGLKYHGWSAVAGVMARLMRERAIPSGLRREQYTMVPVPTTPRRRRRRGYNQASLLAEALSELLNRPVFEALDRPVERPTQVSLPPDQRLANVKNTLVAREEAEIRLAGRPVLLVDDVLTTGATALEAARTLRSVGVRRVYLSTFARALPNDV